MIYYFQPITDNDLILSVDNIIIDVSISNPAIRDLLDTMIDSMANSNRIGIHSWESYKPGTFHRQTVFRLDDDRSFWLGHGLNGKGTLVERYRLDANPNKVGDDHTFNLVRDFLVRNSRSILCRIPRFDLAIDIPVDRSKCFLVKDRRLYIERRHGVEYTQYLGSKSSTVGRVKLYNKSADAKLAYPLTRLELTLNPDTIFEEINFPVVYCIDTDKLLSIGIRVTDTERFILNAILNGCGSLNDLCRKTRAKIELLMQNYVRKISISKDAYDQILQQLKNFCTENYET